MSRRGGVIRLGLAFLAGLVFPALVFFRAGLEGAAAAIETRKHLRDDLRQGHAGHFDGRPEGQT
ncbi:MAG: hypothetical protein EHM78_18870 [Myxococcaceae bacterium]|nr:MAG: hypothetical protein EHM78_18870 [Myxococcaceae bacterium]